MFRQNRRDRNRFQVILELLDAVSTCDLWSDQLHVMHMSDKQHGSSAADTAATGQQQRAARHRQHTLSPRYVVQHFLEDDDVEVAVLSTCSASTDTVAAVTFYHHCYEYQLRLGRQRQVWFILLADKRGVCR